MARRRVPSPRAIDARSPEDTVPRPDPLWDDWETPPRLPPTTPDLHLDGFDGPLDLLLDLVERERIDLARLSIGDLVDQFVAAMARFEGQVPIERRADWLVLASRLLVLRSRLFFAATPEIEEAVEAALERERSRLQHLQFIRSAASWMGARPQIGQDVFGRGRQGRDPRIASYMRLLEACLTVLRRPDDDPSIEAATYRPAVSKLFQVDAVLRRLRTLVDALDGPVPFTTLLPPIPAGVIDKSLLARSAVTATLIGALELCREGQVRLDQDSSFGEIKFAPVPINQRGSQRNL